MERKKIWRRDGDERNKDFGGVMELSESKHFGGGMKRSKFKEFGGVIEMGRSEDFGDGMGKSERKTFGGGMEIIPVLLFCRAKTK